MSVAGLRALAGSFDVFLIDQFGVLHDGSAAYPGAAEALVRLKRAGKRVALISNSGKRATPNEERLRRLGFAGGSWDILVSSGEIAWRMFAEGGKGDLRKARRCLLLARDCDRSAIAGLDLEPVDDAAEADIVLIAGSEGERFPLDHYRALLAPAATARVPAVCTNPDKIMLTPSGPAFGAGRIADLYEELGGPVRRIGKPYPEIYRAALAALGDPPPARVVCVGDSIEHDIVGGRDAGLATVLVRCGILAAAKEEELAALFARHGARPDHQLTRFVWQGG